MKLKISRAVFMIFLIISMPFYSASALAAVQITKNTGDDNINGFIDAAGDTWQVEALITDAATVNTGNVVLTVSGSQFPFNSCSSNSFGTVCQYAENFPDGVIEGNYPFQVRYTPAGQSPVSTSGVVTADGSAPVITGLQARQLLGDVIIDFTVEDDAGVQVVEILDGDTNTVLQTIPEAVGKTNFRYSRDGSYSSILQATLSGEGTQRLKVRAVDVLGHSATSNAISFRKDFSAPEIVASSLEFVAFGDYVSNAQAQTDITLDVLDANSLSVTATSAQAQFSNNAAICAADQTEDRLWHCTWSNALITPTDTISLHVTVIDSFGNRVEQDVSRALQRDDSAPQIEFFGTTRVFEGQSYVKTNDNVLVLRVRDTGSGVRKEGINVNLGVFGRGRDEQPDDCVDDGDVVECHWDDLDVSSTGSVSVSLTKFQDRVGNVGSLATADLRVDTTAPIVKSVELTGVSALGDHDFFQSNDLLKIKITAEEESGLFVLVNLNNVVMDAEQKYPENAITHSLGNGVNGSGWQVFTQENCQRTEEEWQCEFVTDDIKSGPDSAMELEVRVQDTAGNNAQVWEEEPALGTKGRYVLNLLGVRDEQEPDFWELKTQRRLLDFVDLDVTQLSYTRMPLEVSLKSPQSGAQVLSATLQGCDPEGDAPEVSRSLLYGGISATGSSTPVFKLMLEFVPFDGKSFFGITDKQKFEQAVATYTCTLHLFSKVGPNALSSVEEEEVIVEVPFAFSELGALDENLGRQITELKGDGFFKFASALSVLGDAIKIVNFLGNILKVIVTVDEFINLFGDYTREQAKALAPIPIADAVVPVLLGTCLTTQFGNKVSWEWVRTLQIPIQILNCNPSVFYSSDPDRAADATSKAGVGKVDISGIDTLGFYSWWQRNILDIYNVASGRDLLGVNAVSLYDNLYTSILGLCIPGIIYNIEKAREIHCRKIVCYGRDVPAGLATISACNQLYDLQMCQYFFGPAFDFVGLGGLSYIGNLIKSALTSPLGIISLTEIVACAQICTEPTATGALTACKVATGINKVLSIINGIASTVQSAPHVTESPYCAQAEEIKIDQLTTVQEEEPVTEV